MILIATIMIMELILILITVLSDIDDDIDNNNDTNKTKKYVFPIQPTVPEFVSPTLIFFLSFLVFYH